MVRQGELTVHEEDGNKVYRRYQTSENIEENDFLINGVPASTLPKSQVREALEKWFEDGNAD